MCWKSMEQHTEMSDYFYSCNEDLLHVTFFNKEKLDEKKLIPRKQGNTVNVAKRSKTVAKRLLQSTGWAGRLIYPAHI